MTVEVISAINVNQANELSEGRATVHFIAGGDDDEQAREGDRLGKQRAGPSEASVIDRHTRYPWAAAF